LRCLGEDGIEVRVVDIGEFEPAVSDLARKMRRGRQTAAFRAMPGGDPLPLVKVLTTLERRFIAT
jgi:hypothetical protein